MLKKFRQKVTFALGAVVGWMTLVKSDRIMEGEKLNWPLTVHDGYKNRLATIGLLNVYTVKR